MKGLFIPDITAEMFRSGCLESIEALMAKGEIYDIDYEPEQRWISCEERLPEEGQLVLTTIRGTDVIRVKDGETLEDAIDRSRKIVRVSVGFIGSDGWYGVDGYPEIVAPCAWKPLPEPYKGEGEADGQR